MAGFTKDEEMLAAFGAASFLRMWTFPNLFRNQGNLSSGSDGKEICDLIVIFGNDILLFSDKRIAFNEHKSREVAWNRWARKAVAESQKQIQGAERWILSYPDRVYTDKSCKSKLPIDLPSPEKMRFHRIVVTHGLEVLPEVSSNEGSIHIDNQLKGEQNWNPETSILFTLGVASSDNFFHVFTDSTIKQVLSEFDTAQDFVGYLSQRESLIKIEKPIRISKESDIIHLFYENYVDELQKRSLLTAPELNAVSINIKKPSLKQLYAKPSFQRKNSADEASYFWDYLIDSFAYHALAGTCERANWEHTSEMEPALRVLAEPNRFERRVLSKAFLEFYYKTVPGQRGTRVFLNPSDSKVGYLFFLLPPVQNPDNPKVYRELRNKMLQDYALIFGGIHTELSCLVGVAAMTRSSDADLTIEFFSEGQDYVFMNCESWDAATFDESKQLYAKYLDIGLIAPREQFSCVVHEF